MMNDTAKAEWWRHRLHAAVLREGRHKVQYALSLIGCCPEWMGFNQVFEFPYWPDDEDTRDVGPALGLLEMMTDDAIEEIRNAVSNVRDAMDPQSPPATPEVIVRRSRRLRNIPPTPPLHT